MVRARQHHLRRALLVPAVLGALLAPAVTTAPAVTPPAAAEGNEAPGAPLAARSISSGAEHSCAILPSGRVKCWGRNTAGQLGQDSTDTLGDSAGEMAALPPVNLGAGRTATAIATGSMGTYTHTCALLDNATVKCWGQNSQGQLGQGHFQRIGDQPGEMAALPAVDLGAGRTATAIATGEQHTCAILDNGTVKCWGANGDGQLGQDNTASRGGSPGEVAALPPVNLGAGRTATAIAAGAADTCAILDNGTVKCWGNGYGGKLGQGNTNHVGDAAGEMAALAPIDLGAGRTATAITASLSHTCAILDNGTVKCWGFGTYGGLGQDSTTDIGDQPGEMAALPPVNLGAGRTATGISAGGGYTCALLDNASVKCWGSGPNGQLGQDSTATLGDQTGEMAALNPVNLGAGRTATAVTTGSVHTCARLDDDSTKCWGFNATGQLGQGSTVSLGDQAGEMAALPSINLGETMQVGLTADEIRVTPGATIHYHLTIVNNRVTTLTGITVTDPNAPGCVQAVPDLASGASHTINCSYTTATTDFPARTNTATVDTAQTTPLASNPVVVGVGYPAVATQVTAGDAHTCALLDDGNVKCWGLNSSGQLGQGNTTTLGDGDGEMLFLPTVDLGAGRTATAVAAGGSHTCALLDNGTVKCWGLNSSGQLGQGNTTTLGDQAGEMAALPAVNLGAGRTATAIAAGSAHTCALLDNGTVKCWGSGGSGRLGQDSTATLGDAAGEMAALAPVNLGAGRTATAITATLSHTCALLDNGTVKCWGSNSTGQLGQDSTTNLGDNAGEMAALAPVNLGAGRTATAIDAGTFHTCALLDNATVKCWGGGNSGQTGQDTTATLGDAPGEMAALPAINLGAGRTATSIAAGYEHSCAVLDNGSAKCWGAGGIGQLGQDNTNLLGNAPGEMAALGPINLGAGRSATAITAGGSDAAVGGHTCALLDDDTMKCWGNNASGQLGLDSVAPRGHIPGSMAALPVVKLGVAPGPASLSVTMTADQAGVVAGQTIDYHLTVTNTGVPGLTGLTIDDPNAPDCEQAIPDLAVGDHHTIDCSHTTTAADVGTYPNSATVDTAQTAPVASNTTNVSVAMGTVSGTVTEAGSGAPVGGAWIAVLRTSDFSMVGGAVADGSGNYSAPLPAGSYFLYLVDPTGTHTAGFFGSPTTVTVSAPAPVDADPSMVTTRGSVTGTVTETGTGNPISGAWALALSTAVANTGATEMAVVANGSGVYSLPGLRATTHYVGFVDPTGAHETRFHPSSPNVPAATPVPVTAGTATVANATLPPQVPTAGGATISGTVTEQGTGIALAGIHVVALRAADYAMVRGAVTNGSGAYSLNVAAGGYKLAILDSTGRHDMEWYDDLASTQLGDALTVTAPGVANAALDANTGSMTGTVTDDPSGDPVAGAWVIAIGPTGIAGGAVTAPDGTYTITGLAPGTYRATFVDPDGGRTQEYYDDSPDFGGATTFTIVAAGTTTASAALALPGP